VNGLIGTELESYKSVSGQEKMTYTV